MPYFPKGDTNNHEPWNGTAEVVQLRDAPLINDIPGQLRQMADMIESGELETNSVLFIAETGEQWPAVFGWGEHNGTLGNIGLLEWAKAFFIEDLSV